MMCFLSVQSVGYKFSPPLTGVFQRLVSQAGADSPHSSPVFSSLSADVDSVCLQIVRLRKQIEESCNSGPKVSLDLQTNKIFNLI